jgi:hypothetical protein
MGFQLKDLVLAKQALYSLSYTSTLTLDIIVHSGNTNVSYHGM